MKTIAIIAEYNPLHQGHAWQIREARRRLGNDCAVMAIMSGPFTQRGEPALVDKWSRTKMALDAGVNLVFELPFAYACGSAERFASGGVQLVQASGLDCHLVFGSECGDLASLSAAADILAREPEGYRELLQARLDQGLSFPAARQQAFAEWTGSREQAALLGSSNNILAIEYLKAISRLPQSRLDPLTIRRFGQRYTARSLPEIEALNDPGADGEYCPDAPPCFASATSIRLALEKRMSIGSRPDLAGMMLDLVSLLPSASLAELMACVQAGPGPVFPSRFASLILSQLRSRQAADIDQIAGMSEGLGRRLMAASSRPSIADPDNPAACQLETLLRDADTRRFTRTRIQRALMSLICGLTQADLDLFDRSGGPQYLRVLGFDSRGRYLLKIMRRLAEIPVMTKASDFLEYGGSPALVRMADLDRIAADVWSQAAGRPCGRDFDTPVLMR